MNAIILKNGKILFLMIMLIACLASCRKEKPEDTLPAPPVTTQDANFFETQNRGPADNDGVSENDFLCFVISYPIEVIFPGGDRQAVGSDTELEVLIDDWFEANPDAEEYPTLDFPVNVTLDDGTQLEITDEEELCDLLEACWDEDEDENGLEELCFDFVYPLTVVFPDGSSQLVNNDEELEDAVFGWYDDNPGSEEDPTLDYPIEVDLEDGTRQSVEDDEELEFLIAMCEEDFFEDCFAINYPVTILFPDGTSAEVTSDENLFDIVDAWYDANPDSEEDPDFAYPFSVTLEDGTIRVINNEEEIDELFEECFGDGCLVEGENLFLGGSKSAASKAVVQQLRRN